MTNSLLQAMSPASLANKALMLENSMAQQVWLFVEGTNDAKCYRKFFSNDNVKIEPAGDKLRAIGALEHYLKHRKTKLAIAIVDADTDHVLQITPICEELFLTDNADLINQALETAALQYALDHTNNPDKNAKEVRDEIFSSTEILAYLRVVNMRHGLKLNFTTVTKKMIGMPVDAAIKLLIISQKKVSITESELLNYYHQEIAHTHPRALICQGHDLCAALNAYILSNCSSHKECSPQNLEAIVIASYDSADFRQSQLFTSISRWADQHAIKMFAS